MSDSPDIMLERALYYGMVIMCILYGLEIYMFAHSVNLYFKTPQSLRLKRRIYVIIGAFSIALTAIVVFTNVVFLEFMWIDHRDAEGGPLGYLASNSAIWWQTFGTGANQFTNFIGDGLLIYRCYIIWGKNRWIVVFPIMIYLGSIAMALVTLVQSSIPGSDFFRGQTVNFGVPWAALSVSLNIFVTALITARLLSARRQLQGHLPAESLHIYTGISAIMIESALPFSVLGIVFAVTYGKNLAVGPAFLFIWATFCALSPQFIIFRVTVGRSWTHDIVSEATMNSTTEIRMKFRANSRGAATSSTQDSKAATITVHSSSAYISSKHTLNEEV